MSERRADLPTFEVGGCTFVCWIVRDAPASRDPADASREGASAQAAGGEHYEWRCGEIAAARNGRAYFARAGRRGSSSRTRRSPRRCGRR